MSKDLITSEEELFHWGIKGIIRDQNGKILLVEAVNNGADRFWDLPGGRVQRGQTPLETLAREIGEETGVRDFVNEGHLATFAVQGRIYFDQRDVGLILSVYLLKLSANYPIVLSHEHDRFVWLSPIDAADRLEKKFPLEFTQLVRTL